MSVAKNKIPLCPNCDGEMALRNGARGQFYGCRKYPLCRGTRNVDDIGHSDTLFIPVELQYAPITKMPGSDEQEAIWEYQLNGTAHMVLNCSPGSGKTWSQVQYCLRAPKTQRILFVAFNKHIAVEANGKLNASGCYNVQACTSHSLGYQILRQNFKTLQKPDEGKMTGILEALEPAPLYGKADWRKMLNLAERLAGFVKNYLINYSASNFREEILRIADHHGLDLNNCFDQAAGLVPKALDECKRRAPVSIDFDDMIWLPVVLDLQIQHPGDMLIVDESQDLNVAQHELIFKACKGRFVVVGDTHQSIYAFRGAHAESMQVLTKRLGDTSSGVREFPLTITRRCPKLHVQMAQSLFPDIRALDDAPIGEILQMPRDKAVQEMKPGDLVICRVNAALIPTAYDLIRRGIRPIVKGRDIGKGLIQLIDTLMKAVEVIPGSDDMVKIREALSIYRYEHESKLILLGDKAQGRLEALHDKCDCLIEFIRNAKSITEMRTQVEKLFSDEPGQASNAVTLGTIHRTKGLESERVFVLAPELIPHPMARRPWEVAQEKNVAWIACTRAKFNNVTGAPGTLVFCGEIPLIYSGNESTNSRVP